MSRANKPALHSRARRAPLSGAARNQWAIMALTGVGSALMLSASCGQIIDVDRQQCKSVDDCAKTLGGAATAYTCEEGLCNDKVECTTNDTCAANSPATPFCSAVGSCVACNLNTDCPSPTATCTANACVDETWSCLNQPDDRPAPTQSTATFRVKVVSIADRTKGIPGLTVKACLLAAVDPKCSSSLSGAVPSYDEATGIAMVTGLMPGAQFRLKLDAPAEAALVPLDYYTNRTMRDMTTAPDLTMIPVSLATNVGGTTVDIAKGAITVHAHECSGASAPNVKFAVSNPTPNQLQFYSTEQGFPRLDLTATTATGSGTLLNLTPDVSTTVSAAIGDKLKISYEVVPIGTRTAYVNLYPRDFSAQ
jgi:hypothetical protein